MRSHVLVTFPPTHQNMESEVLKSVSEAIGLPSGLQTALATMIEDKLDLGLFQDIMENPNGYAFVYTQLLFRILHF